MSRLTSAQLIGKLATSGVAKSEAPFTATVLGSILTSELGTYVSKKGNHYFTLDGYLIRAKSAETFNKAEVTITLIECVKEFNGMKPGDKFIGAE